MTEKLLRDVLNEALENEQLGLLIWSSWSVWDDFGFELKPGNQYYDFALTQVSEGEEAMVSVLWNGLTMPGFIVIPVRKMLSSSAFFHQVLKVCEEKNYQGPITLIPLNELSDCC